jgi:hypothetical protein
MSHPANSYEKPAHRSEQQIKIGSKRPNRTEDHHRARHEKGLNTTTETRETKAIKRIEWE